MAKSGGSIRQWRDILWMDFALDDASKAASFADKDHYFDPEFGNSWTATFAWIRALEALGHVDPGVLADTTSYAVFLKGGRARTRPTTPVPLVFTSLSLTAPLSTCPPARFARPAARRAKVPSSSVLVPASTRAEPTNPERERWS